MARGILRTMLARYLDVGASDIRFEFTAKGRPLLTEPKVDNFGCNLSHSGDLALYPAADAVGAVAIAALNRKVLLRRFL